jgi:hypothetical protein
LMPAPMMTTESGTEGLGFIRTVEHPGLCLRGVSEEPMSILWTGAMRAQPGFVDHPRTSL